MEIIETYNKKTVSNPTMVRTKTNKAKKLNALLENPVFAIKELHKRSYYEFLKFFWDEVTQEKFQDNWHIEYLCDELQKVAENMGQNKPKLYDLIINIPPGTSKTTICSIFFPVWCWTRWYWMQFICLSYSAALSLESAEKCRDIVRSDKFQYIYPEIIIKDDKDTKSNFRVAVKLEGSKAGCAPKIKFGGGRFSSSVGGSVTGFHGHFIIPDDPINPQQSISKTELDNTNRWITQTLFTRKVDKARACTILIMQRLHENDPTGYLLKKGKEKVKHICLPGELGYRQYVRPIELLSNYIDGMLDPVRLNQASLTELEQDLGQYGYAGQVGQNPVPPAGGMFKVDHFQIIDTLPGRGSFIDTVRYWDKAGTKDAGAYTVGAKISSLVNSRWLVHDIKRGQWSSEERERIIRETAEADGIEIKVYYEQEPGSGGKQSAEMTTKNLAGFTGQADLPKGDKIYRADPLSVQVNDGNVLLLRGDWNHDFIEEFRHFPRSKYKDQVDATSGGFSKLTGKRRARAI